MEFRSEDVAIIGMACIFAGAPNVETYWQNILAKVNAISDPPKEWGGDTVFDPDTTANDRIYCQRGGYLGELSQFSPLDYGVMPRAVDGAEPEHFLALRVAHEAMADAGYLDSPFNREQAAVILGRGSFLNRGVVTALQHGLVVDQTLQLLKQLHPEQYSDADLALLKQELKASLPPFNAETAPGLVSNIMCGRIANRLDLRGPNYAVDAACASSLIAVDHGIRELLSRRCDLALVGGVSVSTPPIVAMIFCQLGAISRQGQIRPFDQDADGTLLGEGLGMVVLKRREDAERDGDRIYALLKGVGVSSDGNGLALLAPRMEGQELALRRAYAAAGVSPDSITLIEAHGTGTLAGDLTEIRALTNVFGLRRNGTVPRCAIGSVKSMISHTIPAAGIAGLIKTALALHHKILPPTLGFNTPNPKFELEKTNFYINTEARPWVQGASEPRHAAVSAFGFGGINAHAVLEEYRREANRTGAREETSEQISLLRQWETELLLLRGESHEQILHAARQLQQRLSAGSTWALRDLAYTLNCKSEPAEGCLAIIASTLQEFQKKLGYAIQRLEDPKCIKIQDRSGIFFFREPLCHEGTLAFLFPGEGSQYVQMLSTLCMHFPEVRAAFDRADRVFLANGRELLPSHVLFPPPLHSATAAAPEEQALWQMDCAVTAVATADQAIYKLLRHLQIEPQAMVGHSSGEFAALLASGAIVAKDDDEVLQHGLNLYRISEEMADQVPEALLMTVGAADPHVLATLLRESGGTMQVAMDNCPNQVVLCGSEGVILPAREQLQAQGAICTLLPFNRAYHTPLFYPVCERLIPFFDQLQIVPPQTTLYSCASTRPYPADPAEIRRLALEQWARPVYFRETIEAMYADGVRIFVEVGPRSNLTGFVNDILRDRRYLASASNLPLRNDITQLHFLLGLLAAHGVPMRLDYLYAARQPRTLSLDIALEQGDVSQNDSAGMRLALELPTLHLDRPAFAPTAGEEISSDRAGHDLAPKITQERANLEQNGAQAPSTPAFLSSTQDVQPATPHFSPEVQQGVMGAYMQTMEHFLRLQEEMTISFMHRQHGGVTEQMTKLGNGTGGVVEPILPTVSEPPVQNPFRIKISSLTPGREVVATCQLDLDDHLFLHDHTIGGQPSLLDQSLSALPVVPLAVSMEIMAQVASLLVPGKRLVGMRDGRAQRWIVVGEQQRTLLIHAHRNAETLDVTVTISELPVPGNASADASPGVSSENHVKPSNLIAEVVTTFGDVYAPGPPGLEPFALHGERPYSFHPTEYYRRIMFHGPSFQSIVAVDRIGDDGVEVIVRVPPEQKLFRSPGEYWPFIDPVLLDAAGQAIGFWTADRLEAGIAVFPIGFATLSLYRPLSRHAEPITCRARPTLLDNGQIRSNIDFIGSGGELLMRIEGWKDMRFDFPRSFIRFTLSPCDTFLSRPWMGPLADSLRARGFQSYRLDGFPATVFQTKSSVWPQALARIILGRSEQETWNQLSDSDKRRQEWLAGRLAAKDAVRHVAREMWGLELAPVDVEISSDRFGRPLVGGRVIEQIQEHIALSISHCRGTAVAVAGVSNDGVGVGVDLEVMDARRIGLEQDILTTEEQALLSSIPAAQKEEWVLRLWCAKEAVAKALGRGMMGGPLNLLIREVHPETGHVKVALAGELVRHFPDLVSAIFTAYTGREDDFVFASALVQAQK